MAINYKSINYGLPGRYPKLPIRKPSTKKINYSKCMFKSVELFNPRPMPYQKDDFKPCTVSRYVDIPRRVNDGFMISDDISTPKQRGIILHKDRYDWSHMKEVLSNQNERLAAEENYVRKVKFLKKLSEQKLKSSGFNLMLEGENVLPMATPDKIEIKKDKILHMPEEDSFKHPAPTMTSNYDDTLENIDLQQPVSMGVHRINLKIRQFAGENISSVPIQNSQSNLETRQNMYIPPDGRHSFGHLPPINNSPKDVDQSFFNLLDSTPDFSHAFKQSERVNRPNVRLNDYVIGGIPVNFNERADIQAELKCLRSLALPATARDLFIGRGIHLPSTHATKNPRMKYFDENMSSRNQMDNIMKIETPGGGSLTINTKTPTNKNVPPDNTPILISESAIERIDQAVTNPSTHHELNCGDVPESLCYDEDGFADTMEVIKYLNGVETLTDYEKRLLTEPLHLIDKIARDQLNVVFRTAGIIMDSSESFRRSLCSTNFERIKPLLSQVLISLDPSKEPIGATELYQSLIESGNLSLSVDECRKIYSKLQTDIKSDEDCSDEYITQSHILLIIPFLFSTT